MDTEEKEMCMNCKRDISVANYQMHTAHCARHITLCQNCDEPIPKKEFTDHRCGGGGGDTAEGPTSVSGGQHILSSGADEPPPMPKPRADKKSVRMIILLLQYLQRTLLCNFVNLVTLTHQIFVIGQIVGYKAQSIDSGGNPGPGITR